VTEATEHPTRRWGVGLHYGGTDRSMPIVDLAVEAEARGFESMFVPEHSHIPTARRIPYPGGGELPGRYLRLWDPLVALSFVAAKTSMVVGTCVCLPAEHDPIAMAKAVATLDVQSGGRVILGVGFGWNDEELEDHGFDPKDKRAVTTEKIKLMQQIWSEDEASFQGEHVSLSPSWSWPKPVQRPYPPVLLGGFAVAPTFRRIVDWADGWIPMGMDPSGTLAGDLTTLRAMWERGGRDPEGLYIMVMQKPLPTDELKAVIELYRRLGVHRVVLDVPTEGADVLLPLLDDAAGALV
jgi:probable F420-dependent oxidoreductase